MVLITPNPEDQMVKRLARLEAACPADVMVWNPLHSATGKWEAAGDGWTIIEDSPSVFCDKLEKRLTA